MVFSFYGNYFLLLKEVENNSATEAKADPKSSALSKSGHITLKDFITKKPMLAETILHKLEKQATKLVEKGLIRHTIV